MKLETAPGKARAVSTPKQAARLYNDIEYELALGEPDAAAEAAGESALSELRSRFPGVESQAREVDMPPHTSRRASRNMHEGRSRRAPTGRDGSRRPTGSAGGSSHGRPTRQRAGTQGRARSGAGGRAGAAAVSVISTAADSSWGELVLDVFVWGAALSIGLLFLTHAAAAGKLFEGVTNAARVLVSPTVDPLNPHGAIRPHASSAPVAPSAAFGAQTGAAIAQSGAAISGAFNHVSNLGARP